MQYAQNTAQYYLMSENFGFLRLNVRAQIFLAPLNTLPFWLLHRTILELDLLILNVRMISIVCLTNSLLNAFLIVALG